MERCPFCGSKHEVIYCEHSSGQNSTGSLPDNAEFYRISNPSKTGRRRYWWRKMGYKIRCKNTECIGHKMSRVYLKKKDAYAAWNARHNVNEHRTAQWLPDEDSEYLIRCSNCGLTISNIWKHNFCFMCGSDMRGD